MTLPYARDELRPVVRLGASANSLAPRALEDRVEEKHCHVATNAAALLGDRQHGLNARLPHPWIKRVQLDHLRPRGKVRVASPGIHAPFDLEERVGFITCVLGAPKHEIFRV